MDSTCNSAGHLKKQEQHTPTIPGPMEPALLSNGDKVSESRSCNNMGTIDHIFDVLKIYEHPFILVGAVAHRWMGCGGFCDEGFDMVLRNDQLKPVVADMIETGRWTLFDAHMERENLDTNPLHRTADTHQWERLLDYCCDADAVLKRTNPRDFEFEYLRLWSEDTYRINMDQCAFVEVPDLHPRTCFLVEEQYHPALDRNDGWWYGPKTLTRTNDTPLFCPQLPRSKSPTNTSPIFIPSIPTYLDALVYHKTQYKHSKPELSLIGSWQIRNLTRYLYLELPHQRNGILFEVDWRTEEFMQNYLAHYKRKPCYIPTSPRETILVKEWDPESYPECVRRRIMSSLYLSNL